MLYAFLPFLKKFCFYLWYVYVYYMCVNIQGGQKVSDSLKLSDIGAETLTPSHLSSSFFTFLN